MCMSQWERAWRKREICHHKEEVMGWSSENSSAKTPDRDKKEKLKSVDKIKRLYLKSL